MAAREVVVCTDGKCKVYVLSRCFRDACLCLRYDMVLPGCRGTFVVGGAVRLRLLYPTKGEAGVLTCGSEYSQSQS